MTPEQRIKKLEDDLANLKNQLTKRGMDIELAETIRDTVFFDVDTSTSTTDSVIIGGGSFNLTKHPTKWGKTYFRGQVIFIPFYVNP